ncbi:MspA family porin [Nocardia sp. NPDC024068]|uniref:MspA family porin n=1 Tax=Nocardia sp. NPDC024068 TaxID=3157197 RepID=UPI0033CF83F0
MKFTSGRLFSCAMGVVCSVAASLAAAPAGNAEVVSLPPHEKTFQSVDGPVFVVGHRDELVDKVPPLNLAGTVREVFLSGVAYSSVDSGAGGELHVGYHVGCWAEFTGASAGTGTTQESLGLEVSVLPGQVVDVPLVEKTIVPGVPGRVAYHDVHLVINGCIGPAVVRQYAEIQMKSDAVDERGVVYGDPLWI